MAVKVDPNKQMVVQMADLLPAIPADELYGASDAGKTLPRLKVIYPIEIDPTDDDADAPKPYDVILSNGGSNQTVPKNTIITVLASRDATRKLVEADGKQSYQTFYKKIGAIGSSHAEFMESLKDESYQKGNFYLIAVIVNNAVTLAELSAFKTASSYWNAPLRQAKCINRFGIQLTANNHGKNVTSSKTDQTKKYIDPKKFSQYKVVELTDETLQMVYAQLSDNKQIVDAWFNR